MKRNKAYLVDTQIFIWFSGGMLDEDLAEILLDPKTTIYLSVASVWEVILKRSIGKLKTPADIDKAIKASKFRLLPINLEHVLYLRKLKNLHRDPFDRILISQAKVENLALVTSDKKIEKYNLETLFWKKRK